MSLFRGPEEHAVNLPSTWKAVKAAERIWQLQTKDGVTLETFKTRRDAEIAREYGWAVRLYDQERRWYAGENVACWRPWAEIKGNWVFTVEEPGRFGPPWQGDPGRAR